MLETYADTPAVVCALKAAELVHLSVLPVPMPTAASVLQVSAIHNLLRVLPTAVLSATIVQAASLAVVMAVISTAAAVSHTCISSATQVIQDPAMCINLLLLQQVYLLNKVVLLHPNQTKIQNTHSGRARECMNTCILYTLLVDHPLAVFLGPYAGTAIKAAAAMKCLVACPIHPTVWVELHLCPAPTFVITANVAATVP